MSFTHHISEIELSYGKGFLFSLKNKASKTPKKREVHHLREKRNFF